MTSAQRLRAALTDALAAVPDASALLPGDDAARTASRLRQRLQRDLLPRVGRAEPLLIAGIAGPNNVGKSSLFNALVGGTVSPARAEGGLTKQCLAAVSPGLLDGGGVRELLADRYELVPLAPGVEPPITEPGPPGRLYLQDAPGVARGLVLLDTPDFDSVFAANRENAEALLVTVDVVLFVVSRHSYQNAAVIEFLRDAVGRGRPYLLVYNEAPSAEGAGRHLVKVAADVGQAPVARYFAAHQPDVERGEALLRTTPLGGAPPLATLLSDEGQRGRLKALAMAASLDDAAAELRALAARVGEAGAEPERLLTRLRHELFEIGAQAARQAVPADVLIRAFQDELDARSPVNRWVRRGARGVVGAVTKVAQAVRRSFTAAPPPEPLLARTAELLRTSLRRAFEATAAEVTAWRGDAATRALLVEAFAPEAQARIERVVDLPEVTRQTADEEALYAFCRELIARELDGDRREPALQALTTVAYALPVGAAGVFSVVTGGVGQDAAVWVAAALSTQVLQRLVDTLGKELRDEVTRRWAEEHGRSLARALERLLFEALARRLEEQVAQARAAAAALTAAQRALAGARGQQGAA